VSFRVAYVAGVTPDKWVGTWRRRQRATPLELTLVDDADQRSVLTDERADVCFVRLPVDRDGLHCIPLYREVPVVVVPADHPVTAYDEIALAELADEQLVHGDVPGWSDLATAEGLPFPAMSVKDAIEVVASGTGIVIVPMSVARLHHRKDVAHRPVLGVPETQIGLAWRAGDDDPRIETFVGIVRGRTENSSRNPEPKQPKKIPRQTRTPRKPSDRKGAR
jgi:DNA-binding transcriptional LysR family regulator